MQKEFIQAALRLSSLLLSLGTESSREAFLGSRGLLSVFIYTSITSAGQSSLFDDIQVRSGKEYRHQNHGWGYSLNATIDEYYSLGSSLHIEEMCIYHKTCFMLVPYTSVFVPLQTKGS